MPVISVITPVREGMHGYLTETYESLAKQEMPPGWDWEWIVQEDGQTGILAAELPGDPRISAGMGRPGRAAMARTLGLARATGVLTRALDADDVLTPGALSRDIETLTRHPEAGWCVSACLDWLQDGSLVPGPRDPAPGRLPRGVIADGYAAAHLPVIATTMTAYTELVRIVGGWQALPATEDVSLLVACEAVSDGWMIGEVSTHYRKWSGQSTAEPDFQDGDELAMRRATLLARVDGLRRMGWRWTAQRPLNELELV